MAKIDTNKLREVLRGSLSQEKTGISNSIRQLFDEAVENQDCDNFHNNGVRICYGRSDGLQILNRSFAFLNLEKSVTKKLFALTIANAIGQALEPLPEDELIYAHFLFHGLNKGTLKEICDKIKDNSRIMQSSRSRRSTIKLPSDTPKIDDKSYVFLTTGSGEDIDGLSFQLFHKDKSHLMLAKCGITFDFENMTAYVVAIQGRTVRRNLSKPEDIENEELELKYYNDFATRNGENPRLAILNYALKICSAHGFTLFKAIDPKSHPLYIGGHHGFKANYEPVLSKAGFNESAEKGLYRVKKLTAGLII